jgi:hypothetical protein
MHRMTITKCDDCSAVIERTEDCVSIGRGSLWYQSVVLCGRCGAPAAQLFDRVAQRHRSPEAKRQIKA